jgi:hypothetical protein
MLSFPLSIMEHALSSPFPQNRGEPRLAISTNKMLDFARLRSFRLCSIVHFLSIQTKAIRPE